MSNNKILIRVHQNDGGDSVFECQPQHVGSLNAVKQYGEVVVMTNSYSKAQAFREKVIDLGGYLAMNPAGSFKDSGTLVQTITVTIPEFPGMELRSQRRPSMSF